MRESLPIVVILPVHVLFPETLRKTPVVLPPPLPATSNVSPVTVMLFDNWRLPPFAVVLPTVVPKPLLFVTESAPALTATFPEKLLEPEKITVPPPVLVMASEPEIWPLNVVWPVDWLNEPEPLAKAMLRPMVCQFPVVTVTPPDSVIALPVTVLSLLPEFTVMELAVKFVSVFVYVRFAVAVSNMRATGVTLLDEGAEPPETVQTPGVAQSPPVVPLVQVAWAWISDWPMNVRTAMPANNDLVFMF
jgi:hypothetical protein